MAEYLWNGTIGVWSVASNWIDLSDNGATATSAPGQSDSVTIGAGHDGGGNTITGAGESADLDITGNLLLEGIISTGSLIVGDLAELSIVAGSTLTSSAVTVSGSSLLNIDGPGATLISSGSFTLGSSVLPSLYWTPNLDVSDSGRLQVAALRLVGGFALNPATSLYSYFPSISVDRTSILEVGNSGTAAAGVVTVDPDGMLSGAGSLNLSQLVNNGTVLASGGTLAVGKVTGTGTLEAAANATLDLTDSGTVVANDLTFAGDGAIVDLGSAAIDGSVIGFTEGDTIVCDYAIGATWIQGQDGTGTLVVSRAPIVLVPGTSYSEGQVIPRSDLDIELIGDYTGQSFTVSSPGGETATINVACFRSNTCILTERGEVKVEDLSIGDIVPTWFSGKSPIIWIGERTINCRTHLKPETVWPVCVRAGALADNIPKADIWLSPDHAVFVQDMLIPIKHLINGTSIHQERADEVTYHHVELPRHDLLEAEGLLAESYLDDGQRMNFSHADAITDLLRPRKERPTCSALHWEALACMPLTVVGSDLESARQRVNSRATTSVQPDAHSLVATCR